MRNLMLFFLFALSVSFIAPANISHKKSDLNGTWVTIRMEINGTNLPEETFKNQELTLKDTTYTFVAESVDKGTIKYTDNKIDIYGKDGVNAGKHFTAIYKLENELLTICYNLAGDKYPDSFETRGLPNYFLAVFKKKG